MEVETGACSPHRVTPVRGVRRAFERLAFEVDAYETPAALYAALDAYLRPCDVGEGRPGAVVELQLRGRSGLQPVSLEMSRISRSLIRSAFHPLVCLVKNQTCEQPG